MRIELRHVFVVLWVLFSGAAISQAAENPRFLKPAERTWAPQLEIKTEHGICSVRLSEQQDGPVRIPLSTGRYSAVLVSTQLAAGKVKVTLAGEEGELLNGGTVPLGQYDFSIQEPTLPWLSDELKASGVGILNMRLVRSSSVACDGCDCGSLCCKPDAGHCIGCGSCGDCCRNAQ